MQGAQQTLAVIFSSMCTIAILLEVVTGAPLVVAANRDELYARPTRPPESLGDGIAGGVDVLSGGTWLAIRRDGRFAAVTNQRALATVPPGLRSRGLAVRELAAAEDADAAEAYVAALDPTLYASMNLVWGDARGVAIAYARREGTLEIEQLPPGIHVLCNDRLGAEGFPRGDRLHDAIAALIPTGPTDPTGATGPHRPPGPSGQVGATGHTRPTELRWPDLVPALQAALADHTHVEPAPSHLPPELARELTATCIHSALYGTRSSTIIAARPGLTLAYLHADGPPCTAPFVDRMGLL
jgi:uncharacterized protein with NRDE domain